MALVNCPNCGKKISDKAEQCPQCGYKFAKNNKTGICAECGAEIGCGNTECQNCGCPVSKIITVEHKKSKAKSIVIVSLILAVIVGIGCIFVSQIRKAQYEEYLSLATATMLQSSIKTEKAGNLINSVWYNTIYEKDDSETDKYTKTNIGNFNEDFNTSLSVLFDDENFKSSISEILNDQLKVTELMKTLKNPPNNYNDAYLGIKALYDSYVKFTNLAINPTGSYNSYSEEFSNLDKEILNNYNAIKIYIE
jgi:ABC-type Na+ efflux pump permease subunit